MRKSQGMQMDKGKRFLPFERSEEPNNKLTPFENLSFHIRGETFEEGGRKENYSFHKLDWTMYIERIYSRL